MISRLLMTAVLMAVAGLLSPVFAADDPLQTLLYSPELIVEYREHLGLTDEQVEKIQGLVEQTAPKAQEQQEKLNAEMAQLVKLLSAEKVDEIAALKQLDDVLSLEKDQKHLHLQIMIQIRISLTAKQRKLATNLQQLITKFPNMPTVEDLVQRLQGKVARVEREVRARSEAGQPPVEVVNIMQKFPELIQSRNYREADALLDKVLGMLGLENDALAKLDTPGGPSKLGEKLKQMQQRIQEAQQTGKDLSSVQERLQKLGRLMDQRQHAEAEVIVDQVLQALKREDAGTVPAPNTKDPRPAPKPDSPAPKKSDQKNSQARPRLSPAEVASRVAGLKQVDVAWRRIDWKTCLLDGLKQSREQDKPAVLWIFIDRPIDDERC